MKLIVLMIAGSILLVPHDCFTLDLGEIGKTIEDLKGTGVLDTAGIDLDRISNYLDWESINISLVSDMVNTTETLGKTVTVDGTIFKQGMSNLRINVIGGFEFPGKEPIRLTDCFVLQRLLKKQAYIVFPLHNAYVKVDPDEVRQMLGQLIHKRDGKPKIVKKQVLEMEMIDGIECKKMHIIMILPNGTINDINVWLAESLKGFPIKIVANFKTPQGITGTSSTLFRNIEYKDPADELFSLPEDYVRYDNLVEVATEGKRGSRMETRRNQEKKRRYIRSQ
jgi:hypothetical protein